VRLDRPSWSKLARVRRVRRRAGRGAQTGHRATRKSSGQTDKR
jgi:hypothetical protein